MRGQAVILAMLAVSLAAGCATSPESAQTAAKRPPEPTVRERANYLFEAVRLSEARKFDAAIGLLLRLQAVESPDDAATTHYVLGSAFAGNEDYGNAAAQYAAAVAKGERLAAEALAVARLGAGHYSFRAGRYEDAVRHLAAWRETVAEPNPESLMELAQAYGRIGDTARAVAVAEDVVRTADTEGTAVRRHWLELLADFYYSEGEWVKSLAAQDRIDDARPSLEHDDTVQDDGRIAAARAARARQKDRRLLPDTETLTALQAQTRALLRR